MLSGVKKSAELPRPLSHAAGLDRHRHTRDRRKISDRAIVAWLSTTLAQRGSLSNDLASVQDFFAADFAEGPGAGATDDLLKKWRLPRKWL